MADEVNPKKTTRERAAGLQNAFAALSAVPDVESEAPAPPAARRPRARAASLSAPAETRPVAMPAEQEHPPAWDARMSLTLSKEMKRALDVARADDGVEGTARIRAMITLWQEDDRLRRRIDKLAKTLR